MIFSLAQVDFTITAGDTRLAWGRAVPAPALEGLDESVLARLENVEQLLVEKQGYTRQNREMIQALYCEGLRYWEAFQQVAERLTREQQIEAQIRYGDMRRLIRRWDLAALGGKGWLTDNAPSPRGRYQ